MIVVRASYELDTDTRLDALGDGRFGTVVSDSWTGAEGRPNGGYLLALCVRALAEVVGQPDPLTVSAHFLRPGVMGAGEFRTEVLRVGRRVSTAEVALVQGGKEVVRAVGSFTDLDEARGLTLELGEPPDLPPPDECVDLYGGGTMPGITLAQRVQVRAPKPMGWVSGAPTGVPGFEFWARLTDGRPSDVWFLPLVVDCAAPAVFEVGAVVSSTVELTIHVRARPAPGWLACRVSTRHVADGFHEEDVEVWDSTGRLVAQSRQLGLLSG